MHEPWAVVCPVTRLPLQPAPSAPPRHASSPPPPGAIPASPPIPGPAGTRTPPRSVIPPGPGIPGGPRPATSGMPSAPRPPSAYADPRIAEAPLPRPIPRTTPAMGIPRPSPTAHPTYASQLPAADSSAPPKPGPTRPPVAPTFNAPASPAPAFTAAASPAVPAPVFSAPAPAFTAPVAPAFTAPVAPTFNAPAVSAFTAPVAPAFGAPASPAPPTFTAPAAPTFNAPALPPAPPAVAPAFSSSPPAAPGNGLVGRVIGERYRVRGVIGEGGMGVVYEAEHLTIGKVVAVKVLHPHKAQNREAVTRLRHEARVAGTLGHPNICAVHDLGRLDDGSPYLVMERLRGETLDQRIAQRGRLAASDMVDIMLQVLSALAAAHQRGVIHRDLKPENIFLSQRDGARPIPKLLDFGISKSEDIEETVVDPTGQRLAAGTPYYMAPEQARGDRGFDWRVDLWSAGVVLYEGLTGQRPFVAKNYNALLVQILSMAPRPMRELDAKIDTLLVQAVDRALAKRPDDRFQSALDFQAALRSFRDAATAIPKRPLPVLINESGDDSDATTVFKRVNVAAAVAAQVAAQVAASSHGTGEDDATPIFAPPAIPDFDDDRTVVETPAFLVDKTIVMSRPDPGRKR